MSYEFYKVVHLVSVVGLFMALGALALYGAVSATAQIRGRRLLMILHGLTMAMILVSGFGLLAKLGIFAQMPLWVYGKIIVWFLLGAVTTLLLRRPKWLPFTTVLMIALAATAAYLVIYRPFQ